MTADILKYAWLFLFILFFVPSLGQQDCSEATSCADCIGTSVSCAWCSAPGIMNNRCMSVAEIGGSCLEEFIENPQGSSTFTEAAQGTLEQFSLSRAELELRVGEKSSFQVTVTPTPNYPLDLYFLMDLSSSMGPFVNQLFNLSLEIASTVSNITTDYRIGFGAFNEKPVMPFIRIYPSTTSRVPPPVTDYSYRHYLSLTRNTSALGVVSEQLRVVTNADSPEAMLDALLQCVVCTELIGWRREARKLVVVFTDQLFHIAGDGLLAGLSRPSDGSCHTATTTNTFSEYVQARNHDYPSIGLVRRKLEENDIIPVFAAVSDYEENYQNLVREIPGAIFQSIGNTFNIRRGHLDASSTPISHDVFLKIIRESFEFTSQRVELVPLASPTHFNITLNAACPRSGQKSGDGCNNVGVGESVVFNVSITPLQCLTPEYDTISLRIPGFGAIPVNVTSICSCLCEDDKDANSTACSQSGDLSCGLCECYDNRYGDRCQCDSPEAAILPCSSGGSQPCSGRGRCQCGVCICSDPLPDRVPSDIENATYYGDNCECDNFNCPQGLDGLVCSGRGACDCGTCLCFPSLNSDLVYRGIGCELRPVEEVCVDQDGNDTSLCSGNGVCRGESCVCSDGYEGKFCQRMTPVMLDSDLCSSVEDCIRCREGLQLVGPAPCTLLNCTLVAIEIENNDLVIAGTMATMCEFAVGSCLYAFYTVGSDQPIHHLPAECRGLLLPIWAVVLISVGVMVVLAVLVFIIVKAILACRDCYDLRKWEEGRGKVQFGKTDNPLYFSPTQKYVNVGYRDRSSRRMSSPPHSSLPHKQDSSQNLPTEMEHLENELLNSHLTLGEVEPTPEKLQWQSYH